MGRFDLGAASHSLDAFPQDRPMILVECGAGRWQGYPLTWREVVGARCSRCGGRKPGGRGRRFCADCIGKDVKPRFARKPCLNCGSMAPKPRGRKVCDECAPIVHEAFVARRKAREGLRRKPCADCGGVKGAGNGKGIYCRACSERRNARPRCRACGEAPIRGRAKQLCEGCYGRSEAARRARRREQDKRRRDRGQPYVKRVRRSDASASRIRYRLARERDGATVELAAPIVDDPKTGMRPDSVQFPNLPSAPLAAAIDRLIRREAVGLYSKGRDDVFIGEGGTRLDLVRAPRGEGADNVPSVTEAVCGRLGIGAKSLKEWREGRRPTVRFDVADKVVTRAGWLWFEIWPDDPVAERAFTGEVAV